VTLATRPYEPGDRPEFFRLMREVWGSYISQDEFTWWFERNPAGEPLIRVAEDEGRVVAVACMSPYRLLVDGAEELAYVPLHVATLPAYRGRGLFARLEEENERSASARAAIAITFPNTASRAVFRSRLGWRDLPRPRLWARPALGRAHGVRRVERFGDEADELARRLGGNGVLRDSTYLNWRFAESPRRYTCLADTYGLAVLGRRGGLAYVAELLAWPGSTPRKLLSACAAFAEGRALLVLGPALGFAPTPKRILVMGKELRPDGWLPGRWRFSLGDGDSW
jgi:predicted N-acetyltransferase YhbS